MTSRNSTPIRGAGQRSIPSTLLFRQPYKCCSSNKEGSDVASQRSKGGSNVSLTSFLNRKLHTASVIPVHKVKEDRLSIPLEHNRPNDESNIREEHHPFVKPHQERTCVIEESVFKLFTSSEEKLRKRSSECLTAPSTSQGEVKKDGQKHLLVLGDDPKPKRRAYKFNNHRRIPGDNEKPRPLYNHYESGTGWWDSEREGVDNDAVGHKEVWEGVGSTTLGGLDWH